MRIIIPCVSFVLFTLGCASSKVSSPAGISARPKSEFRIIKTVRHPLPEFKDTNDNGKLYILKLDKKRPGAN